MSYHHNNKNKSLRILLLASIAYGLPASSAWADFLVNSGETEVTTQMLSDDETGLIEDGGDITVSGDFIDGVSADNNNTITNEGEIQTNGLNADGINAIDGNTIINTGVISVFGDSSAALFADNNNLITHTGTMNLNGFNSFGIDVLDNNTINSSGTINVNQDFSAGILAEDENMITHSGIINLMADFNAGIVVEDDNTIVQSGMISGSTSDGVGIVGEDDNHIINSGMITLLSTGLGGVIGIDVEDGNTILHSGSISTQGDDSHGILYNDDGTVLVSGTIITNGVNSDGVNGDDDGALTITGTIITLGDDSDGANLGENHKVFHSGTIITIGDSSDGFDFDEENADLTVSGTIIATGTASDAIDFDGDGNTLTLLSGVRIDGSITLGSGTDTLNVGNGVNLNLTFDATEGLPEIINTDAVIFATSGNTLSTLDPTGLATSDDVLADITGAQGNAIFKALKDGQGSQSRNDTTVISTHGADRASSSTRIWADGFGGFRSQAGQNGLGAVTHVYGGLISGLDVQTSQFGTLGVFVSGSSSNIDVDRNSQDIDINSSFGGIYGGFSGPDGFLNWQVSAGVMNHDSSRSVANNQIGGGLEKVKADYNGTALTAGVQLGRTFDWFKRKSDLVVQANYAGLFIEDYTETGSTQFVSVDKRDVHVLTVESRIYSSLVNGGIDERLWEIGAYAGVQGRFNLGNEAISATLLGQPVSFDPDDESVIGSVLAGLSATYNISDQAVVSGGLAAQAGTDESIVVSGRLGLNITF